MTETHALRLLSSRQAALILGINIKFLRQLVADGELPFIKIGRGTKQLRFKIHPADLEAFIAKSRRTSVSSWSEPSTILQQLSRKKR